MGSQDDVSVTWSVREMEEDVVTTETADTESTAPNNHPHGHHFSSASAATTRTGARRHGTEEEKVEIEGMFRYDVDDVADQQHVYRRRSSKPVEDQLPGASPPNTPSGGGTSGTGSRSGGSVAVAHSRHGGHGDYKINNTGVVDDEEELASRGVVTQKRQYESREEKKFAGKKEPDDTAKYNSSSSFCCCCQLYCCGRQVTTCMCCLALVGGLLLVVGAAFGGSLLAHYATEEWSWPLWNNNNNNSMSASIVDSTAKTTTVVPQPQQMPSSPLQNVLRPMTRPTTIVPLTIPATTTQPTITIQLLPEARLAEITDHFIEASRGGTGMDGVAIDQAIVWVASQDLAQRSATDPLLIQRIVLASLVIDNVPITIPSWLTSVHECEWDGVECDDDDRIVQSLSLAGRSLSSTIPNALDLLTGLRMLDLSNNEFWGRMPALANTLNLTDLNLANNTLDGGFASEMFSLQNLINVALSGNALTGQVPLWLDQWTSLRILDLSSNNFVGSVPSSLGTLSWLERLDLSNNQMTGTLPLMLFQLTRLQELNLARNSISGSIPTDILLLTRLRQLDLSYNRMTGTLPMLPPSLVAPASLSLVGNNFSSAFAATPAVVNITV